MAWLTLATVLSGRHRLEPDVLLSPFGCLEFGCGQGLNLLFNAAAHPQARFYGVDLNASHIAEATARAESLGLTNVSFAQADLSWWADGLPDRSPMRGWPERYEFVIAHGVASWVGEQVRQALIAAAGELLRPGGLFFCSYNTLPGWLARSTLQMLSQEEALRAGGSTTRPLLEQSARLLGRLCGEGAAPLPLGAALPGLRQEMDAIPSLPESYLLGEYHAGHEALYVGPLHRLCAAHGLTHVGSASLPEMFPDLLDPVRRSLVSTAADAPMREVLLDLAIAQTFRRDLFVKGPRKPPASWRQAVLPSFALHACGVTGDAPEAFDTGLGRMALDADFQSTLLDGLSTGSCTIGEVTERFSIDLDEVVRRLSVLLQGGVISINPLAAPLAHQHASSIADVNQRLLHLITGGEQISALLSPVLLQPVPIQPLESFFLQLASTEMPDDDRVQLVSMGVSLAGGSLKDPQGQPIEDPLLAQENLREFWRGFATGRLPLLRRLGIAAAAPPGS